MSSILAFLFAWCFFGLYGPFVARDDAKTAMSKTGSTRMRDIGLMAWLGMPCILHYRLALAVALGPLTFINVWMSVTSTANGLAAMAKRDK